MVSVSHQLEFFISFAYGAKNDTTRLDIRQYLNTFPFKFLLGILLGDFYIFRGVIEGQGGSTFFFFKIISEYLLVDIEVLHCKGISLFGLGEESWLLNLPDCQVDPGLPFFFFFLRESLVYLFNKVGSGFVIKKKVGSGQNLFIT